LLSDFRHFDLYEKSNLTIQQLGIGKVTLLFGLTTHVSFAPQNKFTLKILAAGENKKLLRVKAGCPMADTLNAI
jgi:hypothetical protein